MALDMIYRLIVTCFTDRFWNATYARFQRASSFWRRWWRFAVIAAGIVRYVLAFFHHQHWLDTRLRRYDPVARLFELLKIDIYVIDTLLIIMTLGTTIEAVLLINKHKILKCKPMFDVVGRILQHYFRFRAAINDHDQPQNLSESANPASPVVCRIVRLFPALFHHQALLRTALSTKFKVFPVMLLKNRYNLVFFAVITEAVSQVLLVLAVLLLCLLFAYCVYWLRHTSPLVLIIFIVFDSLLYLFALMFAISDLLFIFTTGLFIFMPIILYVRQINAILFTLQQQCRRPYCLRQPRVLLLLRTFHTEHSRTVANFERLNANVLSTIGVLLVSIFLPANISMCLGIFHSQSLVIRLALLLTITCQVVGTGLVLVHVADLSEQFHATRNCLPHIQMALGRYEQDRRTTVGKLKLLNMYERIHSRQVVAMTIGTLGSVTKKVLYEFPLIYMAIFIMFLRLDRKVQAQL